MATAILRGWESFSAPKGVERACPKLEIAGATVDQVGFSAPKGVERACPLVMYNAYIKPQWVSVPRRALRGHAPRRCSHTSEDIGRFQCPEGR